MQTLRCVQQILTALCAAVCVATAQPAPGALVDTAQAKALLESPQLADKAWGAYSAALLHDLTLRDALVGQLHWAESLRESQAESDGYACIQSLLDSLIQLGAAIPAQALLPYAKRWRTEVLMLFAARTADAGDEAALLAMREEDLNEAEWLAVNNLLLRQHAASFFVKTLQEIGIRHTFVVSDTGEVPGTGVGGSFGRGSHSVGFPRGFPPIAVYQLEIRQFGTPAPGAEDVLLIRGPVFAGPWFERSGMHRGDVLYQRTIVPAGGRAATPGPNFRNTDRQVYRRAYVAELGGLSVEEADKLFCPTTNIRWRSSRGFTREAQLAMAPQAERIYAFVVEAKREGLINVHGIRLKIDPVINDERHLPGSPLPPIGPREIKLD